MRIKQEGMIPLQNLRQIQNFVSRNRSKSGSPFTVAQMREYCEEKSKCPEAEDEVAIVFYKIESENKFVVMWTTNKLLAQQLFSNQLQVVFCKINVFKWFN